MRKHLHLGQLLEGQEVEEGVDHVHPGQELAVILVLLALVQQVLVAPQLLQVSLRNKMINLIQLWRKNFLMHLFCLMRRMRSFIQVMYNKIIGNIQQMKTTYLQNFQILMKMKGKRIMTWELLRMQMRTDLS